jgi:hypothetical protein
MKGAATEQTELQRLRQILERIKASKTSRRDRDHVTATGLSEDASDH